jgi:hypothetical protein
MATIAQTAMALQTATVLKTAAALKVATVFLPAATAIHDLCNKIYLLMLTKWQFSLLYQVATQTSKPDFDRIDLPGRSTRAMLHRWDKLKLDHQKIVEKRAGEGASSSVGGGKEANDEDEYEEEQKPKKRAKRSHRKKAVRPLVFPNLKKMQKDVAKAGEEVEEDEEDVAEEKEEVKAGHNVLI